MRLTSRTAAVLLVLLATAAPVQGYAQAPAGPPSVGVVRAEQTAITETSEFIGRIQAIERVALTARVTAFLDQRLFKEGTEVQQGDLLYRLERAPFEAAVQQQEASVADASARLTNANIQLARAQALLNGPAGQRSNVDDAVANQRSLAAQLLSAQAQLQVAQIVAVQADCTAADVIEAWNEVQYAALAAAGRTDQGDGLAPTRLQAD